MDELDRALAQLNQAVQDRFAQRAPDEREPDRGTALLVETLALEAEEKPNSDKQSSEPNSEPGFMPPKVDEDARNEGRQEPSDLGDYVIAAAEERSGQVAEESVDSVELTEGPVEQNTTLEKESTEHDEGHVPTEASDTEAPEIADPTSTALMAKPSAFRRLIHKMFGWAGL
ncbi:hypothetical protein [Aurantiacibacter gilvus]|uniref:Uncharacterized protein n=1 Tax=Aurantiacibacter gilvus TaxID=3139141 RepID=A0ABU9IAW8_9SPHN